VLSESDWLGRVRAALHARPDAPYSTKSANAAGKASPPPRRGRGRGGGEANDLRGAGSSAGKISSAASEKITPPPTPSPSRGGGTAH
jgi:hypothetical protein